MSTIGETMMILEALHEAELEVEARLFKLRDDQDDGEFESNTLMERAEAALGKILDAARLLEK